MVAVNSQYDSSGLLTWRQSTADITYKLFLKIHACLQFDTYGCIGLRIRLHQLTLTAAFRQVPLQLRNHSLWPTKVPVYARQVPLEAAEGKPTFTRAIYLLGETSSPPFISHYQKSPFHRSFTPVADVFSHNKFHAFTAASGD